MNWKWIVWKNGFHKTNTQTNKYETTICVNWNRIVLKSGFHRIHKQANKQINKIDIYFRVNWKRIVLKTWISQNNQTNKQTKQLYLHFSVNWNWVALRKQKKENLYKDLNENKPVWESGWIILWLNNYESILLFHDYNPDNLPNISSYCFISHQIFLCCCVYNL